jgi:ribonuclease P protein component
VLAVGHRLRRRDEFAAVVKTGRRAGRGCLVVHVLPSVPAPTDAVSPDAVLPDTRSSDVAVRESPVRVGFVIPRAVGNAVARNQVRRRLRHLVRDRISGLPAGTDVVVRASAGAAACSYEQLGMDLAAAMTAANASAMRAAASRAKAGRNGQPVASHGRKARSST